MTHRSALLVVYALAISSTLSCKSQDATPGPRLNYDTFVPPIVDSEAIACIDATHVAVLQLDHFDIFKIDAPRSVTSVASVAASADKVVYDWMASTPGRLYVSDKSTGAAHIYDMTNVEAPVEVGTTTLLKSPPLARGLVLYEPDPEGFVPIDATDPKHLVPGAVVKVFQRVQKFTPTNGILLAIVGDALFVLNGEHTEVSTYSLANPMAPAPLARANVVDAAVAGSDRLRLWGGAVRDNNLLVGASRVNDPGVRNGSVDLTPAVFDVSDPAHVRVAAMPQDIPPPAGINDIALTSDTIVTNGPFAVMGLANIGPGGQAATGVVFAHFPNGGSAPSGSRVYIGSNFAGMPAGDQGMYRDVCFAGGTLVMMNDRTVFIDPPR